MTPDRELVGTSPEFVSLLSLTTTLVKSRNRPVLEMTISPPFNEIADVLAGGLSQSAPWVVRRLVKPFV